MATGQTILHLGRGDDGRVLTAEEFAEASYDEPWKYERVDGRLVVMYPDSEAHDGASDPWRDRLVVYRMSQPQIVEQVTTEAWLFIADRIDRIADIAIYLQPAAGSTPQRGPRVFRNWYSRLSARRPPIAGATMWRRRPIISRSAWSNTS